MIKDMTKGNPSKILLSFAMPMILSGMFQQFYNIADSVIAGNFAGVDALAAIGASYPITMLFIAIATGSGIGCSIIISQLFGFKDYTKTKTAIFTAIISITTLSILLTILGNILCSHIIKLLNTPQNIFDDSSLYLRIYVLGLIFLFIYNIGTSTFNALGDSKTPLYFLIFSSMLNIILDLIFMAGFNMGVAGAAWATFIAQGISSILTIVYLFYTIKKIETKNPPKYFEFNMLIKMSKIAIPSIIQQSIVSLGQLFIQALVNSFGSNVVAGYSAAIKIDSFFKIIAIIMGNSVSSFTAQNIGAKKLDRVIDGKNSAIKAMLIYSVASAIIIFIFKNNFIGFFIDSDSNKEVIKIGVSYLTITSLFYFPFSLLMISNGILRAFSKMKSFMFITLTNLFLRVFLSYFLANFIGYNSIWWSIVTGWIVGMILGIICVKITISSQVKKVPLG
ncbi:MATE family efflux transporter [Defluviitalea phaphyphila]|uniref:MATE family efflux transporter n=1 Tax=Defluviitalea phaphyphila TaxID=1473580 RepID=UPI0007305509|nr:MATE family efflux transporter [Defluviitalea phaphyphila]